MEKHLEGVVWVLIGLIYCLISYITNLWNITWVIIVIPLVVHVFLKLYNKKKKTRLE